VGGGGSFRREARILAYAQILGELPVSRDDEDVLACLTQQAVVRRNLIRRPLAVA
jgi:hypothetical protein